MYADYADKLGQLREKLFPPWNFVHSVYPAGTLNYSLCMFTKYHKDYANRAMGWCSVYAGGNFNLKTGGHLVLPELKLTIKFPPGSVISIPSATLEHGNLPVKKTERCFLFTQYIMLRNRHSSLARSVNQFQVYNR